ncbi:MAG: hypothetical protein IJV96_07080 [Clostridia bacterium]|nr:hypothetical protein [Clostridia bacterium]
MIAYLYLVGAMLGSTMISVSSTFYTKRNLLRPHVSRLYSLIVSISVTLGWLCIFLIDPSFDARVLLYSLGYGVLYTVAMLGLVGALGNGSVALTAFFKQLSLVAVSVWGFFFWNTPVTATVITGIALIVVALALCLSGKKDGVERGRITLKWVLYILMLLVGNAGCSIIQKYQQMAFDGKHGSMMMLFATAFSIVVSFLLCLREDKTHYREAMKKTWHFPALAGLGSALLNFLVILLAVTAMSPALIYPGIAVGGFILTTLASVALFGERPTPRQWVGLSVGAVAIVFLNL